MTKLTPEGERALEECAHQLASVARITYEDARQRVWDAYQAFTIPPELRAMFLPRTREQDDALFWSTKRVFVTDDTGSEP